MSKEPSAQPASIQLPREDDPSARLLEPQDLEEKPKFKMTFSTVKALRAIVFPLAIADSVLIPQRDAGSDFVIFLFMLFVILLQIWSVAQFIGIGGKNKGMFEIRIGNFLCAMGKINKVALGPRKQGRPYEVILGDFTFCILLIIVSIVAGKSGIWYWNDQDAILGLSITLASLQLAITFFGFFSLGRSAKIMIFETEENEGFDYPVSQIYMDNDSEPRQSMSSIV